MQPAVNSPLLTAKANTFKLLAIAFILLISSCASKTITTDDQERSFTAYIELAASYLQQGNTSSAEDSLAKAAEISEEDPRLLQGYALLYQFRKQIEDAEEMYIAALKQDPDFSQARNNYGVFLSNIGRNAEALVELNKAAKDTNYSLRSVAYENLSQVALKINNLPLAAESMQNASALMPTEKKYFLRTAHLLFLNKEYDKGQEYFDRFLVMNDSEGVEPTSEALRIGYALASARNDKSTQEYIKQRLELLGPQASSDSSKNER